MPKLINCARCGEITQQEQINGKHTKNCKRCRDQHNKQKNVLKTEQAPAGGFYKQEHYAIYTEQEETTEEEEEQPTQEQPTQEDTPQEEQEEEQQEEQEQQEQHTEADKPIKQLLKEIITNIKCLNELQQLQHEQTTDILKNINNKIDNTINNINNTTPTSETDLNEYLKKQQTQNKILVNKLDSIIKAIT